MKIYNTGKKILVRKINPLLKRLPAGSRVLDVGCGGGDLIRYLASHYKKLNFIGEDIHQPTLNYARQFKQGNTQYILGNGEKIPLNNNSVDFIYSTEVIEHSKNDKLFIKEIKRVLKRGSLLMLTTPNRKRVPFENTNPDHKRHYIVQELRKLLVTEGFKTISTEYRWPKLSREIDYLLNKLKDRFLNPKTFQPCVTAVSKKRRSNWKFKLLLFLFDRLIDPILTIFALADFKINGSKEKYNIMIICKKE